MVAQILGEVVIQLGDLAALQLLHDGFVGHRLAGHGPVGILGRDGDGEVPGLVGLHAQDFLVEGAALGQLDDLVLVFHGLHALGLDLDVEGGEVADHGRGVFHRDHLGGLLAQLLQVLGHGLVVDDPLLLQGGQALVVGQADFGGHVELDPEGALGALFQINLFQGRPGNRLGSHRGRGGHEVAAHQGLGHFGENLALVAGEHHILGRLAGTEARDLDLGRELGDHLAELGRHLGGGNRDVKGFPCGGVAG